MKCRRLHNTNPDISEYRRTPCRWVGLGLPSLDEDNEGNEDASEIWAKSLLNDPHGHVWINKDAVPSDISVLLKFKFASFYVSFPLSTSYPPFKFPYFREENPSGLYPQRRSATPWSWFLSPPTPPPLPPRPILPIPRRHPYPSANLSEPPANVLPVPLQDLPVYM